MNYVKKENIFDKFFNHRDSLIIQFKNGDITKREYIKLNMDFMQKMNVKPFKKIDSFEKGIYNYQYFNMLAKYYYMEAKELNKKEEDKKYSQSFLDEGYHYYKQKDKSTFKLLKFLKFKNIEAYYIKVNSENLQGKLYEINLKDYDKAILHSKSFKILDTLKKEGVFIEGVKKSLIDDYVNVRY
ncbi:MAG: hypothetical protein FH753_10850 [Firmicutes bacterium]|nr:hypothetical protein [Bacillota bacterium]MTI69609.1 hypothetical protein [Bacillota bacterium]